MADELRRIKDGNQLLFADHATDFGSAPATAANSLLIGTQTDIQIDLTSVAASGGARQSAKSATLVIASSEYPTYYRFDACVELTAAPTDGGVIEFYWAGSGSSTAGTGNPGGVTGTDSAFTDTTGNLAQMTRIGVLVCRANAVNIGYVGILEPEWEYGSLVMVNQTDQNFHSAMDETHIVATPYSLRQAA